MLLAAGSSVEAGAWLDFRDRATRAVRWQRLDDDLAHGANARDRDVVARDQIRTVVRTFRDTLFSELFPGRRRRGKTPPNLPHGKRKAPRPGGFRGGSNLVGTQGLEPRTFRM